MITLYHAPLSRSSAIVQLLDELGALDAVTVTPVQIRRFDGSGGRDPANPHPEGKVPLIVAGEETIRERAAIIAWLCARFPAAGLAPAPGAPGWGAFLSWLAWYQGVVEPVLMARLAGVSGPVWEAAFRGEREIAAALSAALAKGPWLMGAQYGAADLLLASPYLWRADLTPDDPAIRDWVARAAARPSAARTAAFDAALMAPAAGQAGG